MKKTKRVSKRVLRELSRVSTPTITTVLMKEHGLHNVAVRGVWPCNADACRFAGPAHTVRYLPVREDLRPAQGLDHRDNLITPMMESMPAGAVLVLDAGGRNDVGMLGGNLVMRMKVRGMAAAVTDGGMRDLPELANLDFPVFATETAAPPSFTALMAVDTQCPVACGGVPVFPGDVVVGDAEGVVVVPAHLASAVTERGLAVDHIERYVHRRLARGEPLPGLYPPGERVRAQFEAWVAAGEPEL